MANVGEALARELAAHRGTLNAMFAARRGLDRTLNADDFYRVLSEVVSPVVQSIADAGEDTNACALTLYELALTLTQRGLLGPRARSPHVGRAWTQLLVLVPSLVAREPRAVVAALSNAAHHLSGRPDVVAQKWFSTMAHVASFQPTLSAFLDAGKVAAWSSGLAHFRASAIQTWENLEPPLAKITLRLSPDDSTPKEVLRQQLRHAFLRPGSRDDAKLECVHVTGGFRGFGQPFVEPPEVFTSSGQVFARDSLGCFLVSADAFGATLERAAERGFEATPSPFEYAPDGTVSAFGTKRHFPNIANAMTVACNRDFVAATLAHSHQIWIVAWSC
ncbi:MAG: hypothetical protein R3E66_01310 [bacterium]